MIVLSSWKYTSDWGFTSDLVWFEHPDYYKYSNTIFDLTDKKIQNTRIIYNKKCMTIWLLKKTSTLSVLRN